MENILFENTSPNAEVKLIDFGLSARYLSEHRTFSDRVGTMYTMAPQVLEHNYTSKADIWSVGVVAYILLSNTKPFCAKRREMVGVKIMSCDYSFEGSEWDHVSDEAKNFISLLLTYDPDLRLDANEALHSRWLDEEFLPMKRKPSFMDSIHSNIIQYSNNGEFKKLVLMVIAHRSPTKEILNLRRAFQYYDSNNDGYIRYSEFKKAFSHFKFSRKELNSLFDSIDMNKNGVIFYSEFIAATLQAQGKIEEDRLAEAFDRLDCDDSGYITKENLKDVLGDKYTDQLAAKLIEEFDIKRDGKISYKEFLVAFHKQKKKEIKFYL